MVGTVGRKKPARSLSTMAHPRAGRAAPYLIQDRYEDTTVLREMVRHKWTPGAHRAAPKPVRYRSIVGLVLAVAAVPASWGALLTGVGLPDRVDHTVQFPGIHATRQPDRRPPASRAALPAVSPHPSTVPPPNSLPSQAAVQPLSRSQAASPSPSASPSDTGTPAYQAPPLPPPATAIPPVCSPSPPRKGHKQ